MKLTLTKKDLSKALGLVSPYIKGRNTLPILSCVSIEANEADGLTISGTDLETGVKVSVPGVASGLGCAVVNLNELKRLLKGVKPSHVITLERASTANVLLGLGIESTHTISGMDPSEYPVFPITGVTKSYEMPGDVFRSMLGSVSYAAEKDNFRYFLNGVYFNLSPKTSEFVATDGRRLALSRCAGLDGNLSGIIPLPAVKRSLKTFDRSDRVEFGVNKMNDTLFIPMGLLLSIRG